MEEDRGDDRERRGGDLIVKELSRLGREYLQVGQLTELYFPEKRPVYRGQ